MFRLKDRRNGKRHFPFYEDLILKPCPICGKTPKIKIDWGYYVNGFGGWVDIKCRKWYELEPHKIISSGKSDPARALDSAIKSWNRMVDQETANGR